LIHTAVTRICLSLLATLTSVKLISDKVMNAMTNWLVQYHLQNPEVRRSIHVQSTINQLPRVKLLHH